MQGVGWRVWGVGCTVTSPRMCSSSSSGVKTVRCSIGNTCIHHATRVIFTKSFDGSARQKIVCSVRQKMFCSVRPSVFCSVRHNMGSTSGLLVVRRPAQETSFTAEPECRRPLSVELSLSRSLSLSLALSRSLSLSLSLALSLSLSPSLSLPLSLFSYLPD